MRLTKLFGVLSYEMKNSNAPFRQVRFSLRLFIVMLILAHLPGNILCTTVSNPHTPHFYP